MVAGLGMAELGSRRSDDHEMDAEKLLGSSKTRLRRAFGSRLHGIVLYGSVARGEATTESDIDLLVLLEGPVDAWHDLRKCVEALYDLQLEITHPIHAIPVSARDYHAGKYALYRNVKKYGVSA
jgi:predicted nucleotidyltransferase